MRPIRIFTENEFKQMIKEKTDKLEIEISKLKVMVNDLNRILTRKTK